VPLAVPRLKFQRPTMRRYPRSIGPPGSMPVRATVRRTRLRPVVSVRRSGGVALVAIDRGKPLPGKGGLSRAEREELNRLPRENRQLKTGSEISWQGLSARFAMKGDTTSAPPRTRGDEPGRLQRANDVPSAEGLGLWLLRVAQPSAEPVRLRDAALTARMRAIHRETGDSYGTAVGAGRAP
jgi:hypothetical protein